MTGRDGPTPGEKSEAGTRFFARERRRLLLGAVVVWTLSAAFFVMGAAAAVQYANPAFYVVNAACSAGLVLGVRRANYIFAAAACVEEMLFFYLLMGAGEDFSGLDGALLAARLILRMVLCFLAVWGMLFSRSAGEYIYQLETE